MNRTVYYTDMTTLLFTLIGYLSGSVLSTKLYASLFHTRDVAEDSADKNPGAFNAFSNGGFICGMFVLFFDIFKAFWPVSLYLWLAPDDARSIGLAFVLWAPVFGHLFPLYCRFHGGKGIASTFGVLLALWAFASLPLPVFTLAFLFLFFKLIIQVRPDLYLTAIVFLLLPACLFVLEQPVSVLAGCSLISASVMLRLSHSREKRPALEVKAVWKH